MFVTMTLNRSGNLNDPCQTCVKNQINPNCLPKALQCLYSLSHNGSLRYHCPHYWYFRWKQRHKSAQGTCSGLIHSSRFVTNLNIYLSPSNFMTLIRLTTSHLQRRVSSSYLKANHMLPSISANLVYIVGDSDNRDINKLNDSNDHLSPILSNFLPTIFLLTCLAIDGSMRDLNKLLDSSLISAFLYLLPLIDLSYIHDFPLVSLTLSINLLRLDISVVFRPWSRGSYNFCPVGDDA